MTDTKRLGVVGTLVWDTIYGRDGAAEPVEEWGGIGYALAALSAALPAGWTVVPLVKVGRDLAEEAFRFVGEIPRVDPSGIVVVEAPNNRVELRYQDAARRVERLSGGVPGWQWPEVAPLVATCDALYVNFISGFELDLDTARALRAGFGGPVYADLHSLFLRVGADGLRVPAPLAGWEGWLRSFDAVQMNEDEFSLLGGDGDPWALAAHAVGPDLKLIVVTLGERGAAYVSSADFVPDPMVWRSASPLAQGGPARSGRVVDLTPPRRGDPTGCGDVWGATFFARLLGGAPLEEAMRDANAAAARNVEHRGARGLYRHLSGRLSHAGGAP